MGVITASDIRALHRGKEGKIGGQRMDPKQERTGGRPPLTPREGAKCPARYHHPYERNYLLLNRLPHHRKQSCPMLQFQLSSLNGASSSQTLENQSLPSILMLKGIHFPLAQKLQKYNMNLSLPQVGSNPEGTVVAEE